MGLIPYPQTVNGVGITRQRHHDCLLRIVSRLGRAREMLATLQEDECVAAEVRVALDALGEMLGEDLGSDVLDLIFSEFCIGK